MKEQGLRAEGMKDEEKEGKTEGIRDKE